MILQEEELIERYKARRLEYIVDCCQQLKICPSENCGLVLCMEIKPSSSPSSSSSSLSSSIAAAADTETVTCKACGEQVPRNMENVDAHVCTANNGSGVGGSILDFFGGLMNGAARSSGAVSDLSGGAVEDGDNVSMKKTAPKPTEPKTVICSNGHSFCSLCDQPAHAPTSCDDQRAWVQKVKDEISDASAESGQSGDFNDLANALWLKANTKKCPRCSALIEKDEGCNHMTCRKCRHDFCWICMQPWSLHSNNTGGYFQCNRFIEDDEEGEANSKDNNKRRDTSSGKISVTLM